MAHIRQQSYDGTLISPDRPEQNNQNMHEFSNGENFRMEEEGNIERLKEEKRNKKSLDFEQISVLHEKKKNLISFIQLIGEIACHPIRFDVLEHCEKVSVNLSTSITKEVVVRLTKNRVEKMIKNKRIKKNWSEEDIKILVWVISKYCQVQKIGCVKDEMEESDWDYIANLIPGVTGRSCMFKWLGLKKNNLAENCWAEQESLLLDDMVKKYGEDSWCIISEELYLKNTLPNKIYRCPKQCREHWNCYLNPILKKGPWEKSEDVLLFRSVKELNGVKKWAQIVKMFNGRTENALKNRFNLIVDKEMKDFRGKKKPSEIELVEHYLKKNQNYYSIPEEKLQYLCHKKENLGSKTNRKKAKVVNKTPKEHLKYDLSDSEEDQYFPESNQNQLQKRLRNTDKSLRRKKYLEGTCVKEDEEEAAQRSKSNYEPYDYQERELSFDGNIMSKRCPEEIFYEDEEIQLKEKKKEGSENQIRQAEQQQQQGNQNEDHTNEENINIDANSVQMVSFDPSMLERLKREFDRQHHSFVPCTITPDNFIISYRMNNNSNQ